MSCDGSQRSLGHLRCDTAKFYSKGISFTGVPLFRLLLSETKNCMYNRCMGFYGSLDNYLLNAAWHTNLPRSRETGKFRLFRFGVREFSPMTSDAFTSNQKTYLWRNLCCTRRCDTKNCSPGELPVTATGDIWGQICVWKVRFITGEKIGQQSALVWALIYFSSIQLEC